MIKQLGQHNGEWMVDEKPKDENVEDLAIRAHTTLKIWSVPYDLAMKFVSKAKNDYGNKSWMLLKDLMEKAEKFDELSKNEVPKILELEERISKLEENLEEIMSSEKSEDDEKVETFGGNEYGKVWKI